MNQAFICDAVRTPFGRYGGALATVRTDDLGAIPIRALMERNVRVDWDALNDVIYGCANQSGEDNRNVARMSLLLAGLPTGVPGATINRLCGSGLDALGTVARAIRVGEMELAIAGGVESMTRAPYVMAKTDAPFSRSAKLEDTTLGWRLVNPKMKEKHGIDAMAETAENAFSRAAKIEDTTIGWRFVNPLMKAKYGIDSMPETAENVAAEFNIARADQDAFALRSQQRAAAAIAAGRLAEEIVPVTLPAKKGEPVVVRDDEHPRATTLESLSKLKGVVRPDGTVTAGNASGVNDGACATLIASADGAKRHGLTPRARIVASAVAGVAPRIMGFGPAPAMRKVLSLAKLSLADMSVIELNEAFAAQALAVTRDHKLADDDPRVNPNGGAIALGHPLGASGARLVTTALYELERSNGRYALCTMCIGVGQGIAMIIERV